MKIGNKQILFCDICPATYAISEAKEKLKRNYKDLTGTENSQKDRLIED